MRRSRSTEAQIVDILREFDAGVSIQELARTAIRMAITETRLRRCTDTRNICASIMARN